MASRFGTRASRAAAMSSRRSSSSSSSSGSSGGSSSSSSSAKPASSSGSSMILNRAASNANGINIYTRPRTGSSSSGSSGGSSNLSSVVAAVRSAVPSSSKNKTSPSGIALGRSLSKLKSSTGSGGSSSSSKPVSSSSSKTRAGDSLSSYLSNIKNNLKTRPGVVDRNTLTSAVKEETSGESNNTRDIIAQSLLGGSNIQTLLDTINGTKSAGALLDTKDSLTGLKNTDNLSSMARENQKANIDYLEAGADKINQQIDNLAYEGDRSTDKQDRIIRDRMNIANSTYLDNIRTAQELGQIDTERLNLITNQNAKAQANTLVNAGLLNSEQAQQGAATLISDGNQQIQLKKLDIDAKTAEMMQGANSEFSRLRNEILSQEGLNEADRYSRIRGLTDQYSQVIEALKTNALNEKKAADNIVLGSTANLSAAETSGASAELSKMASAKTKLDNLEKATRSPKDKARYLFSEVVNFAGTDPVVTQRLNSRLTQREETGALSAMKLSSAFEVLLQDVREAIQQSAKAQTVK